MPVTVQLQAKFIIRYDSVTLTEWCSLVCKKTKHIYECACALGHKGTDLKMNIYMNLALYV